MRIPRWCKSIMFLIMAVAGIPSQVFAEPSLWKSIDGWDIRISQESYGCVAETGYRDGSFFSIGFGIVDGSSTLMVLIGNRNWKSIESGKEYDVAVKFGNEPPWTLPMIGVGATDYKALSFIFFGLSDDVIDFARQFRMETGMVWSYSGRILGSYSLKSSAVALEEATTCTKSLRQAVSSSSDPFIVGTQPQNDPFLD